VPEGYDRQEGPYVETSRAGEIKKTNRLTTCRGTGSTARAVEDLEDLRDLREAVRKNGDTPLIPWSRVKKELEIG